MGFRSKQRILYRGLLGHRQPTSSHKLSKQPPPSNSISTTARICRSYSRKYPQYELMFTKAVSYLEDYNSWVSSLFPSFYILSIHSAVMSVSSEQSEVDLDDLLKTYSEHMYMCQYLCIIFTMGNKYSVMLLLSVMVC